MRTTEETRNDFANIFFVVSHHFKLTLPMRLQTSDNQNENINYVLPNCQFTGQKLNTLHRNSKRGRSKNDPQQTSRNEIVESVFLEGDKI